MSFRYTPYDVRTFVLNAVDTVYTADSLTTRLNVLFGGLISYNYTFEARASVIGNAIEIEINSFLDNDAWQNTALVDFVFSNGTKARKMTTAPSRLITGGTVPTGTISQNDEVRAVLWDTSTVTNGFGAFWGGNYTPITNQFNKNAFNMYCSGGNQFGSSFFTIVNPTFTASQEVRIGQATYDDDINDYSLISIPGNLFNDVYMFKLDFGPSGNNTVRNGVVFSSR